MTIAALYIDPHGPYPRMQAANAYDTYDEDKPVGWISPREDGLTIDCWDASRDARKYDGPHPVVAHPPCKHWGRLRHLAKNGRHRFSQESPACVLCGGEPGFDVGRTCPSNTDVDCAPRAVEQVRQFGGVLEHPAGSKLWEHCRLPQPSNRNDARCRVCGHFEIGFVRANALYAHCPSCNRAPHWLKVPDPPDSFGGYAVEVDQVEWGHVARKRTWLYLVGVPREALEAPPFPGREPTHWASGGGSGRGKVPSGVKVCSAQQRRRTPPLFAEYLTRLASSVAR